MGRPVSALGLASFPNTTKYVLGIGVTDQNDSFV